MARPQPDRLELRLHPLYRLLCGLVFWPAGCLLIGSCSGLWERPSAFDLFWVACSLAAGFGLLTVGGWNVLDLGRVRLDRAAGLVTAGRLPGLRRDWPLQAVHRVQLDLVVVDEDCPDERFRAFLVFREGSPDRLRLNDERDSAVACDKAVRVADFLGVPLRAAEVDRKSGKRRPSADLRGWCLPLPRVQ